MISIVILFIGMMGVLDFLCTYQRMNIENTLKNEASKIAETQLEQMRSQNFAALTSGAVTAPGVSRTVRNLTMNYGVTWTVQTITPNSRAVQVDVTWTYPAGAGGRLYQFNAQTIIGNDV
jgi:Tfp pilus assembly protein PilV